MQEENVILHVCALNPGGIETFVMNVYRELINENIRFDFINYFDKNKEQFHEKEVLSYGSKIYKTGSFTYKSTIIRHIHKCWSLYMFLKTHKYDVIHIHVSDNISLEDAFIAKLAKVKKIIVHSHNASMSKDENWYKLKLLLHKKICKLWTKVATDYIACSELAAKWMFGEKLFNEKKITIVKNGININKYKFNREIREEVRKKMNLDNKVVVGHIGRFSYQKNHDFLIDVFNNFLKTNDNSVLLLIGEGELKDKIKDKVKKYNIEKNVIFYGLSESCEELMQAMDIFLLPSHFEGLPLVGIEAQTSGLKVIASSNISEELNITSNIKSIQINDGISLWCNYMNINCISYKREDMSKIVEKNGYSIAKVANAVKEYYIEKR